MSQSFSIQVGKFLYKNAFPLYNRMYPIFKRKQDVKELKLIHFFVKPDYNVLDIGANIGFYTNVFSKIVGSKGNVYAFEPEAINFNYLKQNCKQLGNVTLTNKAVSEKTGPIKIYLSKVLNVDHRTYPVDDYEKIIEIKGVSIDDFVEANKIAKIDFIKMDIQGFEMSAFKGMEKTLRNNPNVKIISELWPYGLAKAGHSASAVYDLLTSIGFQLFLISETEVKPLNQQSVKELVNNVDTYYNIVVSKENFKFTF